MKLTADEQRALAFIAALLLLSAAVRVAALPEPLDVPVSAGFDADAHLAATERAVTEEERRSRPLAEGEKVDPNTASAVELDRLPGVGPALAERIVEARSEGRFQWASDLVRVPGVGERTAERLAPFLDLPAAVHGMAGVAPGSRRARLSLASSPERAPGAGAPVALNSADAGALTALPGVGPVLAARIVAHREREGPFASVDSLLSVPGIGPATLERIRPLVRVR